MSPYRAPTPQDECVVPTPTRKPLVVAIVVITAVVAFALFALVTTFGSDAWLTAPVLASMLAGLIVAFRRAADPRVNARYRAQVEQRADAWMAMMR